MIKIEVGMKVEFRPFQDIKCYGMNADDTLVVGTVVEVHKNHRWFSVVYGKQNMRISFKFQDIGDKVWIVEG